MMRIIKVLLITLAFSSYASAKVEVGGLPPNYLGKTKSGDEVNISDYKGKVVIVTFWASWCSPCLQELPVLEGIQRQVGQDQLKVVAINYKEGKQEFERFYKKISSYQLTVTKGKRQVISSYDVKGIPFMVIVGKDGKIARVHTGYNERILPMLVDEINMELEKS